MKIANATVVLLTVLLAGCASVTVTKLSPNSDNISIQGQRFSLPRPYIQVTPNDDGTVEATIIYLPDPERTYAIDSSSYLATDTLDVTIETGQIKIITWTGDSSGVVSEAIKSSANVASEILKAEETKKAAEKSKLDDASKAVDDAQLEFDLAESKLALLKAAATPNAPNTAAIQDAEIALKAARIKLDAAKKKLAQVRGLVKSPAEIVANDELFAARKEISDAVISLSRARAASPSVPSVIQRAESDLADATQRFAEAYDKLQAFVDGQPQGMVFGPMLFAINEELRISPQKKVVPFLEIVTAEQHTDPPTPKANWNPPQPQYPVKWPEVPRK